GFKRQVASQKALGAESNPDAEGDRDCHPQRQVDFVFGIALLAKDQILEFLGAHQRARQSRGHAQLDKKIDENEPRFQHGMNFASGELLHRTVSFPARQRRCTGDQLPIVPAACCKSFSTLQRAGTPPWAKSRLPPPRPPMEDNTCLSKAPMSAEPPEVCAKTSPGGSIVLATSAIADVPARVTFCANNFANVMSRSAKIRTTIFGPLGAGRS